MKCPDCGATDGQYHEVYGRYDHPVLTRRAGHENGTLSWVGVVVGGTGFDALPAILGRTGLRRALKRTDMKETAEGVERFLRRGEAP